VTNPVGVLLAALVGTALLFLPGFGARDLLRRPRRPVLDETLSAVVATVFVVTPLGVLLVGTGSFSTFLLVVPLLVLSVVGLPRAISVAREALRIPLSAALGLFVLPWVWSALRTGAPPSYLFQWYYWDLARMLGRQGGVPSYVTEYGAHIRWLPDYLVFNLHSEAYRGITDLFGTVNAIVAWRIPMALLAVIAVFAMLRLWVPRWAAVVGVALVMQTTWALDKFNAYKPEAFGVIIGFICVRLAVGALRRKDPGTLVLVGVLLGVNLGIHAIAATVVGMLLAGALVGELLTTKDLRARRTYTLLFLTAVTALVVSFAMGWSVQGRVSVLGDAGNPQRNADGSDPTLIFLARDAGNFGPVAEPSLSDEMTGSVNQPRVDLHLTPGTTLALAILLVAGAGLALARGGNGRRGVVSLLVFVALLVTGILYFTLRYDTYVPRHTGLSRFAQYTPLVVALAVTVALSAIVEAVNSRIPARDGRFRRRLVAITGIVLAVGLFISLDNAVVTTYDLQVNINTTAKRFLETVGDKVPAGETVLVNANSRGLLGFLYDLNDPLEARQALLESPKFVHHATVALEDMNKFFTGTGGSDLPDRMRANWLITTTVPSAIGSTIPVGTPPPDWSPPGWELVVKTPEASLWHRTKPLPAVTDVGPEQHETVKVLVALLLVGLVIAGVTTLVAPGWPDRIKPFRRKTRKDRRLEREREARRRRNRQSAPG
jgi:hypothetical protein